MDIVMFHEAKKCWFRILSDVRFFVVNRVTFVFGGCMAFANRWRRAIERCCKFDDS